MKYFLLFYLVFASAAPASVDKKMLFSKTRWHPTPGTLHKTTLWYEHVDPREPFLPSKKVFSFLGNDAACALSIFADKPSHRLLRSATEVELWLVVTYFTERVIAFAERKEQQESSFSCLFKMKETAKNIRAEVTLRREKDGMLVGEVIVSGHRKEPPPELINLVSAALIDDGWSIPWAKVLCFFGVCVLWLKRGALRSFKRMFRSSAKQDVGVQAGCAKAQEMDTQTDDAEKLEFDVAMHEAEVQVDPEKTFLSASETETISIQGKDPLKLESVVHQAEVKFEPKKPVAVQKPPTKPPPVRATPTKPPVIKRDAETQTIPEAPPKPTSTHAPPPRATPPPRPQPRRGSPEPPPAKPEKTRKTPIPPEILVDLKPGQREAFDVCGCGKTIRIYAQGKGDFFGILVTRGGGHEREDASFLDGLLTHVTVNGVDKGKMSAFYSDMASRSSSYVLKSDGVVCLTNKKSHDAYCIQFGRLAQDYVASGIRGLKRIFSRDVHSNFAHATQTAGDFAVKVADATDIAGLCGSSRGFWVDWLCYGSEESVDSGDLPGMWLIPRGIVHFNEIKGGPIHNIILGSGDLWRGVKKEKLLVVLAVMSSSSRFPAEYLCEMAALEKCDYAAAMRGEVLRPAAIVIDLPKLIAATS